MPEQQDYIKLWEEEKKKVSVLEKKLALFEDDPEKRGYFSLRRIVNAQIDILNSFNLSTEIGSNPKDDKKYDRTKSVWEGLKSMLLDLKALKLELSISPQDEANDNKKQMKSFTPESIADAMS